MANMSNYLENKLLDANTSSLLNTGFGISSDISNTLTLSASAAATAASLQTTIIKLGNINPKIYLGDTLIYPDGYGYIQNLDNNKIEKIIIP